MTPEINAVAAIVMAFSLLVIFVALRLSRRRGEHRLAFGSIV